MNVPKTSLEPSHYPVMLNEVIKISSPEKGGNFLDCTFGGGGYSESILSYPKTKVIALDRDKIAEKKAKNLKKKYLNRFSFYREKFSNLDKLVSEKNNIDKVIFDLGLSTFQLLDLSRGFSFKAEQKIDMNMGLSSLSAEEVINYYEEKDLKLIIKLLGDEKEASKIVKNIVRFRKIKKISTVKELVEIIKISKRKNYSKKINVSTKTFQALRIFVNKETTELIKGISKAAKIVKPGGKIIVISFHSIEDKIVKYFFNNFSSNKSKPSRYLPEENSKESTLFESYKNNLIRPSDGEVEQNPPSRSAKLRFATRNSSNFKQPDDLERKFKKYIDLERINA